MAKVKIQGHASGTGVLTVTAPNTSTDRTITLPDESVTLGAATPSIDDNGDATAITIDSSERVGLGTASPDSNSKLHIYNGASGQSAATNNTEVVIENSSTTGISFLTPNNASSGLWFADPESNASGRLYYTHSDNSLNVFTGGTQRLKIDGDGLKFNSDTAAANALNDYEEGTWTPIFDGDGSNPTVNYAAQFGIYTKVGRLVHVSWNFTTNSVSGGSGNLRIAGLPFAASSNQSSATGACRTQNWNSNANSPIVGYINNNESFVVLNRYDSAYASHTTVKTADLRTSGDSNQFKTSITYFTDA